MWLMSQQQELWPEHAANENDAAQPARPKKRPERPTDSPLAPEFRKQRPSHRPPRETTEQTKTEAETETELGIKTSKCIETVADRVPEKPKLSDSNLSFEESKRSTSPTSLILEEPVLKKWPLGVQQAENDGTTTTSADSTGEDQALENSDEAFEADQSAEGDDSSAIEAEDADATVPRSRLAELRVKLRFRRADIYLGAAVLVAAVSLMWPTVSEPHRGALGPMGRVLVTMGLAEAPTTVIHLKGDPGINVWVDPHTALYYCPGEEQYGKTADGRFSSQHDAQLDRFEPAGRSVCE